MADLQLPRSELTSELQRCVKSAISGEAIAMTRKVESVAPAIRRAAAAQHPR